MDYAMNEPYKPDLRRDLINLLNAHGYDNRLNVPDYVLADYLLACLSAIKPVSAYRDNRDTTEFMK
jgi:hypothetical protein